jgi:hypothetical protein
MGVVLRLVDNGPPLLDNNVAMLGSSQMNITKVKHCETIEAKCKSYYLYYLVGQGQ